MNRRKFLKSSLQYISGVLLCTLPFSLFNRKKEKHTPVFLKEAYFYKKKY